MENRMKNSFVLLALVIALAHSNRADEQITVPTVSAVPAIPTVPSSPISDSAHAQHSEPGKPASTDPALNALTNGTTLPVQIEVFYEALCKDTVDFVQNQLSPVYNKLNKFINVSFSPFGQGSINNVNGTKSLVCKRPGECEADKVHACGIKLIKENDKLLKFVNCALVEGFKNKTVPIEECVKNSTLDSSFVESIKSCTNNTDELYPLLEHYSKLSHENNVKSVPKIVINRNYSTDTIEGLSSKNLITEFCKLIPTSESLAECKNNTVNGSSTVVVGILPLIISVFYFIRMF